MVDKIILESIEDLKDIFNELDKICLLNSEKVLNAFRKNKVSDEHFNTTTGYGYDDTGREIVERVYADIFKCEDALVRTQIVSGTHALSTALFGVLRPNDTMLSITGKPYDTLEKVIGIKENASSLKSFGVNYEQIDLINNDFDYNKIKETLENKNINLIHIQRSKGYENRESISIEKLEKVIKFIKDISKDTIVFIDNCYCEFVSSKEPTEVGSDLVAGSLIKNLGGGIASNGGYIVGRKDLVSLVAERLTVPGQGKEVGPDNKNKDILKGLYFAPSVVTSSLKTVVFASYVLEKLGYKTSPKYNEKRTDIVQTIIFNDREKLIKFVGSIQKWSAINSHVTPIPSDMPGYHDKIIMASGSFTQGSSIEISCDGPVREPYQAFLQGSLTYEYGRIAITEAVKELENN